MNSLKNVFTLFSILSFLVAKSQDTLPKFSVRNVGKDRYIIGWVNNYEHVSQISIQRSFDSLKNFKTILSVADPNSKQNGFVDTQSPNDHMYYRLFVVLSGGSFYFTETKRPVIDTTRQVTTLTGTGNNGNANSVVFSEIPVNKSKDSVAVVKKDVFIPSFYVFTNKSDGNVLLNLPNADEKKYSIRFFEEDGSFLFEIKNIKEPSLIVDKSNFYHSGWFLFELFEGERLKEKHKFYLGKDF